MSLNRSARTPGREWVAIGTSAFLLAALIAVGLALAGGWATWGDLDASAISGWRIRPLWLAAAVGSEIAALCLSGAVWGWLFRAAGGRAGIVESSTAWLGSNLGRYIPGKIWQVTGLVAYVRARGGSGATALGTVITFQAAVLVTGAGMALASLGLGAFESLGRWPLLAGGLAVAAALTPPVLRAIIRLGRRLLRETAPSGQAEPGHGVLFRAVIGSLVIWPLHGLGFLALLHGLVLDHGIGFPTAMGVFSGAYVLGYLALVAPGGLVVREGAIVGLLTVVAGIPAGPAAAFALAARLWTTLAEIVAFGLLAVLMRKRPRGG